MSTNSTKDNISTRVYRKRLGAQEERIVGIAEAFTPTTSTDWSTVPTTQDQAIDTLAAENSGQSQKWVKAQYDFSTDGGVTGDIALSITLPDNALVLYVSEEVLTDYDSAGNAGTIKLKLPVDGDLTNNQTADGIVANADGIPNWAIANSVKSTAARICTVEIGTENLTAGKSNFYIAYVISE